MLLFNMISCIYDYQLIGFNVLVCSIFDISLYRINYYMVISFCDDCVSVALYCCSVIHVRAMHPWEAQCKLNLPSPPPPSNTRFSCLRACSTVCSSTPETLLTFLHFTINKLLSWTRKFPGIMHTIGWFILNAIRVNEEVLSFDLNALYWWLA